MKAELTKREMNFIDIAAKNAMCNEKISGARICAILAIRSKVISFGNNQYKSHPLQASFSKNDDAIFLHAEIDSIRHALRFISVDDLKKTTLYIARVKEDKKRNIVWALAKPCKGCMAAIESFDIGRVVYTSDDGEVEIMTR